MRDERKYLSAYMLDLNRRAARLVVPPQPEQPSWGDWWSYFADLAGYLLVAAGLGVAVAIVAGVVP